MKRGASDNTAFTLRAFALGPQVEDSWKRYDPASRSLRWIGKQLKPVRVRECLNVIGDPPNDKKI